MSTLNRVLVANRGEIALRIIRACHELGIEAVAAYSKADKDSRWVELADSAVHIGGSPAAKSYLNTEAVLEAARATHADAVHPGYGFLADVESALVAAEQVGYPLLVKASAGGGGRGIRPVESADELPGVFSTARAEAASAFGDGTLYLERALMRARHIEVQVLADNHGNVVHTYERDCSVQRRRQKLIEEAPAPNLDPSTRDKICDAAARLAAHVGYRGAGTVEFLLAEDGSFYFMEMNTRIQVEHPISECVTGVDLVAEQLRIAGGERLSVSQDQISLDGTAIELRINAEDPDNGFEPTPGEITRFDLPGGPGVRLDTGFTAGDRISPFYDSMIAKLICWGADRQQAVARARQALAELAVEGVPTTVPLYLRVLADPEFGKGAVHTGWLENWSCHETARLRLSPRPEHRRRASGPAGTTGFWQRSGTHRSAGTAARSASPCAASERHGSQYR